MLIPVSHDFVEMRGCLTARVSYRLLSRTGHIHFLFTSGRAPARPHVRSRSRAGRPLTPEAPALVWSCARFAGRPASPPLAGVAQISSTRPPATRHGHASPVGRWRASCVQDRPPPPRLHHASPTRPPARATAACTPQRPRRVRPAACHTHVCLARPVASSEDQCRPGPRKRLSVHALRPAPPSATCTTASILAGPAILLRHGWFRKGELCAIALYDA